jgi:hypothetical protein
MASSNSRGNYYKQRSKKYYESLGYTVQLTEFNTARQIGGGRLIYTKIDIFGSDGIAMNGKEIIFWNSKSVTGETNSIANEKSRAKKEFEKYPFPPCVKLQAIIWEPRKQPVIIDF